jgi:spermidine/putrescine transport system substrate-binding protein
MSNRSHRTRQPFVLLPAFALLLAACSAQSGSPGASSAASASAAASEAVNPSCAQGTTAPADMTGALTVLDWAGYDAKDFWTDFAKTYPKVDVGFEIGESDSDIFSKMSTGDQADIFHPYTGWLQLYVDKGLVEPIDTSRLANWDKVPESFKKIGQVNGKQYFIPWDWGFTSILYRTDKVPGGVDSWNALFDPKYAKHVSMWDDGPPRRTSMAGMRPRSPLPSLRRSRPNGRISRPRST